MNPRTLPRRTSSSIRPRSAFASGYGRCGLHRSASSITRCNGSVFDSYRLSANADMNRRRAALLPSSDTSTTHAKLSCVPTTRPNAAPMPSSSGTSACRPPKTMTGKPGVIPSAEERNPHHTPRPGDRLVSPASKLPAAIRILLRSRTRHESRYLRLQRVQLTFNLCQPSPRIN
jgi:hypothetical protein